MPFTGRRSLWGRIRQLVLLYRLAVAQDADVYHCNELESWAVGVLAAWKVAGGVVFDVHEVYSTNVAERLVPPVFQPFVRTVVRLYMRMLTRFTDALVFAKGSVRKDFPPKLDKITLVRNYVEVAGFDPVCVDKPSGASVTALHLGAINRARGWPELLQAMTLSQNQHLRVRVVGQFGDGSEADFLDEVKALGLSDRVEFTPWVPYDEVRKIAASSDIGLVVFQPVHDNFINALPHKLFDYMLAGLPVIAPDFAIEVAEIVEDARCGILVDTTEPRKIAEALDRLAEDQELREKMGQDGRKAVLDRYNWESEARALIEMYRSLMATRSRPAQTRIEAGTRQS